MTNFMLPPYGPTKNHCCLSSESIGQTNTPSSTPFLAAGFGATSLAGGRVGGFEPQCVVFVFGDVVFVSRHFMCCPHGLFGLQQVFGELFQHLPPQQELIHDQR